MPMKTCLWSCLGCIQAVPQDIWTSQILKCSLSDFSFPRFSSFPTPKLFPGNSITCVTPATHPFRWPLHMPKPSGSLLVFGYPRARPPLPLMVEKKPKNKISTLQGGYARNLENAQNLLTFSSHLYSVQEIKKEHRVTVRLLCWWGKICSTWRTFGNWSMKSCAWNWHWCPCAETTLGELLSWQEPSRQLLA